MSQSLEKKKIVILGSGFGGLSAALELGTMQTQYQDIALDIVVIDRNDFQLFTPDLYEIASASKDIASSDALKNAVCIDVRLGLAQHHVRFVQATIESVDPKTQSVKTTDGDFQYDQLIIALGSESFHFGIPGMKENSIPFKWLSDAVRIRETIFKIMETKEQVRVLVCGAGPAGVELASELRMMCEHHLKNRSCFALTLVEGRDCVLSQFGQNVQKKAERRLKNLGVTLQKGFVIEHAEAGAIVAKDGRRIEGDIIIWTGGVRASSVLEKTGLTLTPRGQVEVDTHLRTLQYSNISVIGDSAQVPVGEKAYSPMTAHEAVHQGPVVAYNSIASLRESAPELKSYSMKNEGFVIAMGGKNGLVILANGMVLSGRIGWFARKYVDFRHFQSVLPFMQACSFWYQGIKTMSRND